MNLKEAYKILNTCVANDPYTDLARTAWDRVQDHIEGLEDVRDANKTPVKVGTADGGSVNGDDAFFYQAIRENSKKMCPQRMRDALESTIFNHRVINRRGPLGDPGTVGVTLLRYLERRPERPQGDKQDDITWGVWVRSEYCKVTNIILDRVCAIFEAYRA